MTELFLSLYVGSLFLIVSTVAPILLRTETNKDIAGRFYGKILWRFYGIAFFLLLVYLILSRNWLGLLPLGVLLVNVGISKWLREYKKTLGNIEDYAFNSPERAKFRKVSYVSTFTLLINFFVATIILLRGG